jgi:hypothetical protein
MARNNRGVLALGIATLVIGVGVFIGFSLDSHKHINASEGGNGVFLVSNVVSPTSSTCGSWATSATDPVESTIVNQYGAISSCQLIGFTWVLVTRGVASPAPSTPSDPPPSNASWTQSGTVATYRCDPTDVACLDPTSPHPYANWKFNLYPNNGFLVTIGFPTPTELLFQIDGSQWYFNTQSGQFTSNAPSAALSQCWQLWSSLLAGQNLGTDTATPSVEQSFEQVNPQCVNP